jgi:hypothetical protein
MPWKLHLLCGVLPNSYCEENGCDSIPRAQRENIHGEEEHFTNTPLYKGKIEKRLVSNTYNTQDKALVA